MCFIEVNKENTDFSIKFPFLLKYKSENKYLVRYSS